MKRLRAALRKRLPYTLDQDALADGQIVLCVTSSPKASREREAREAVVRRTWHHVSYMCFKPYRPTLRLLQFSHVGDLGHTHLWATHEYHTMYEFLDAVLDEQREASVAVYKLWNGLAPLLSLDPIVVEVVAFGDGDLESGDVFIDAPRSASVLEAGDAWQHALADIDSGGSSFESDASQGAQRMILASELAHRLP
jgi:hypothetical protein